MSVHYSETVGRDQAKKKANKFGRRGAVIGLAFAVFAASGAAWAAMTIFGTGQAKADKYEAKPLAVSGESFSGKLFPGAELDLTFTVKNDNPFPVKITHLDLDGTPAQAVSTTCNWAHLSTSLPVAQPSPIPAASQAVVGKDGATAQVTIPKAVKLALAATDGCTFDVKFKVTGTQSGN